MLKNNFGRHETKCDNIQGVRSSGLWRQTLHEGVSTLLRKFGNKSPLVSGRNQELKLNYAVPNPPKAKRNIIKTQQINK